MPRTYPRYSFSIGLGWGTRTDGTCLSSPGDLMKSRLRTTALTGFQVQMILMSTLIQLLLSSTAMAIWFQFTFLSRWITILHIPLIPIKLDFQLLPTKSHASFLFPLFIMFLSSHFDILDNCHLVTKSSSIPPIRSNHLLFKTPSAFYWFF